MKRGVKLTLFSLLGLLFIVVSIFIYRGQTKKVDVDEINIEPQILSDTLMSEDDENCLEPDIIVYTTIDDILNDRDPQMEKVLEIIKK